MLSASAKYLQFESQYSRNSGNKIDISDINLVFLIYVNKKIFCKESARNNEKYKCMVHMWT